MALGFDPYTVLGVSRDATGDQITQARRRLVRRYHPDVNPAPDAAARFAEVQQAFRLLSDPATRAEYDRTQGQPGTARPAGNHGQTAGAAASRFSVQPHSVDFGIVEPGKPGVYKDVVVCWTGTPPGRVAAEPGTGWWTVVRTGKLALSGVVFHLHAQAPARAAHGCRHAQLTITLDGTAIAVPLTAEFGDRPPVEWKSSPFAPNWPSSTPNWSWSVPDWVLPVVLAAVVFIVMVMYLLKLVLH